MLWLESLYSAEDTSTARLRTDGFLEFKLSLGLLVIEERKRVTLGKITEPLKSSPVSIYMCKKCTWLLAVRS